MIDDVLGNGLTTTQDSSEHGKAKNNHKMVCTHVGKSSYTTDTDVSQSKKAKSLEQPQVEQMLLPQGETSKSRAEVNDRKKNPRLAGADLYVTRLGWNNDNVAKPNPKKKFVKPSARNLAQPSTTESDLEPPCLPSPISSTRTLGNTGSLYDELRNSAPKTPPPVPESAPMMPREAIHASRPCYRCVSYMHSVGISVCSGPMMTASGRAAKWLGSSMLWTEMETGLDVVVVQWEMECLLRSTRFY